MVILLEDLTETILLDNGVTPLMKGMSFITDVLNLSWKDMERIFVKCASEFSEAKPREDEIVITAGESGTLPENLIAVKAVRYGFLAELPKFLFDTFEEDGLQWNLHTRELKVFPPISEIRISYVRELNITKNVLITDTFTTVSGENELEGMLRGMYRTGTLTVTKGTKTMEVTSINSDNTQADLSGDLGTGTINLSTREFTLSLDDTDAGTTYFTYYPKYKAITDFDVKIGHKVFPKLYEYRLLTAVASIRAQASQENLHLIDLSADDLQSRVIQMGAEVKALLKSSFPFNTVMNL